MAYVETNYAFNNAMRYDISDQTTHWKADGSYLAGKLQYQTPCSCWKYTRKKLRVLSCSREKHLILFARTSF